MKNPKPKSKNAKNKNAIKHGVFTDAIIIPGEDRNEFKKLHGSLIQEWKPAGPTEHDTVSNLAKCIWRKRRLVRYRQNELSELQSRADTHQKDAHAELEVLVDIVEDIETAAPGSITQENISGRWGESWAEYFNDRFERAKYQNDSDWLMAIVSHIDVVMHPSAVGRLKNNEHAKRIKEICFDQRSLYRELDLEDRIDAMIDKFIKRLAQIKTLKEIIIGNHAALRGNVQRQIAPPPLKIVEHS
jgi:hypothetical protein